MTARLAKRTRSKAFIGAMVAIGVITAFVLVYQKYSIGTALRSGGTVEAEFTGLTKLHPDISEVKVAGVEVGKVSSVDEGDDDRTLVAMKVDTEVVDKLGSTPAAVVRSATLLGGSYYVELVPSGDGGKFGNRPIPAERTRLPVELDHVLSAIPPRAQDGLRTMARQLDRTLQDGGRQELQKLMRESPETWRAGGEVLSAMRGTSSGTDLSELVTDLQIFADVMTAREGQLGKVVDSLAATSSALSDGRAPLAETVQDLPQTLQATSTGMRSLKKTLNRLTAMSAKARPSVRELDPLLKTTDSVLRRARPMVADLRPTLRDLRPAVDQLVPVAKKGTSTLDNLKGPVLDRLSGPVTDRLVSPWHGKGAYDGNGNDHRMYEEVGYLAARAANLSQYGDKNGPLVSLSLGAGISSVGGLDVSMQDLLELFGTLPPGAGSVKKSPGGR